jgi:hypothetical protein
MHALGSQHLRRRATRHRGARCHLRLDVRHSGETLIAFALPLIALRAIALPADGCTQSEPWCRTRHLLRRRVRQPARSVARLPLGTRRKESDEGRSFGASTILQLVRSGSHAASRPGARSPTKAPAPCRARRHKSGDRQAPLGCTVGAPRRTRVHAKAELRAGRHNGWTVERRASSRDWRTACLLCSRPADLSLGESEAAGPAVRRGPQVKHSG